MEHVCKAFISHFYNIMEKSFFFFGKTKDFVTNIEKDFVL